MKMSEMYLGQVAVLCVDAGRNGITPQRVYGPEDERLVQKVEITKLRVKRDYYSERTDGVEVIMLDHEGKHKVVEDSERNRRMVPEKIGKPITKVVPAKILMNANDWAAQEEKERKEREERERRRQLVKDATEQMTAILLDAGIDNNDLYVSAQYNHEMDAAEISQVRISGDSVNHMVMVFQAAKK